MQQDGWLLSFDSRHSQTVSIRARNKAASLPTLGARVRRSLLRLAPIHLRIVLPAETDGPLRPELFKVPNVQSITLPLRHSGPSSFLSLLHHPGARQLRSLNIARCWNSKCTSAELKQMATLPHLHSLSVGGALYSALQVPIPTPQQLEFFPALTHLSLKTEFLHQAHLFSFLSRCIHIVTLDLECVTVCTEFVDCLTRMTQLQRLQLHDGGGVKEQSANAWAALRSLREIHLEDLGDASKLLPVLSSAPALRLLQWRCRASHRVPSSIRPPCLPTWDSLNVFVTAAPQVQVELGMPLTFDEWTDDDPAQNDAIWDWQQQAWAELR
jgi:hypothetical protein